MMQVKLDFIQGNTKRCLLAMAIPMVVAMFLNMAYSLIDSIWIGNLLGETAYAALTNSTPIILILNSIAMGATNGVSILISQTIGAKQKEKTECVVTTSLIIAILFSIIVIIGMEIILKPVLTIMQTPIETFQMAYDYLAIYLLGYLSVFLYCYFTAVLRSFGNTTFQMIAMLCCILLNAIFDPIFINCMGLSGAAIATVISQTICLIATVFYLYYKKLFSFHLSAFQKQLIPSLFIKGIPAAFQQSIPAISTGVLTSFVSGYGITAIAAYGITGKLETILFYPAMALNMVLTTIVGQCVGGKRYDRVKSYMKYSLLYGSVILLILSLVIIIFSRQLSGFFVKSSDVANIVAQYFTIVGIGYILNTVTNCFLGSINGMGKPFQSMLCMILYYLVIRIPLAGIFYYIGCGLNGIWIAVLLSHIIAALTAIFMGIHQLHLLEKGN